MKKVISTDGISKTTTMDYDAAKEEYIIETVQNVDGIKDMAKEDLANHRLGSMIGNTQRHYQKVAEIPNTIYYDLLQKFGSPQQNQKAWFRWLQNNDNKAFRTTNGRLI